MEYEVSFSTNDSSRFRLAAPPFRRADLRPKYYFARSLRSAELLRMVAQVPFDERRDEIIAVVVTLVTP